MIQPTTKKLVKFASFSFSSEPQRARTNHLLDHPKIHSKTTGESDGSAGTHSDTASANTRFACSASPTFPPTHHDPSGSRFRNPWPSAVQPSTLIPILLARGIPLELARKSICDSPVGPTRLLPAQLELYDGISPDDWKTRRSTKLIATWLGHAGCLVQFPTTTSLLNASRPFRVIFDPIFSTRAGPSAFTGPKRLIASPCRVSDLPSIDVCCISHSHYDHLDYETVKELIKLQPHLRFYVPLGLKVWFTNSLLPAQQVFEMDWWDSNPILFNSSRPSDPPSTSDTQPDFPGQRRRDPRVEIHCVPAQHSSGRSLLDQNTSLWCGWVIEQNVEDWVHSMENLNSPAGSKRITRERSSVYFAGDTGYRNSSDPSLCCPAFTEIGQKFGPIDFSMIPIWRGGSLSFISWAGLRIADETLLSTHHASPTDAVKIHQEVRSRHSIAVHHGCFVGSAQESVEALEELESARVVADIGDWMEDGGFGAVDVGQTVEVDVLRCGSSTV